MATEATKKMVFGVGISISNTQVIFSHPSEIEMIGRCAEENCGTTKCKDGNCGHRSCSCHPESKNE